MKKLLLTLICVLIFGVSIFAQDDKKDALAIVDKLFNEMANHNPSEILSLWQKDAVLAAIIKTKEGKTVHRTLTPDAFSKNFAVKKGELKELMYKPKVEVYTDFAMVWGRYVFLPTIKFRIVA